MWSYEIDQDENLVAIRRNNIVYTSVTFNNPTTTEDKISWMYETTDEVRQDFPDEVQEFTQSVKIPYLSEIK